MVPSMACLIGCFVQCLVFFWLTRLGLCSGYHWVMCCCLGVCPLCSWSCAQYLRWKMAMCACMCCRVDDACPWALHLLCSCACFASAAHAAALQTVLEGLSLACGFCDCRLQAATLVFVMRDLCWFLSAACLCLLPQLSSLGLLFLPAVSLSTISFCYSWRCSLTS
jgi:hypothetical protein